MNTPIVSLEPAAINGRLLLPQHLADLRKSGLTDATIAACGFRSVQAPATVQQLLHWQRDASELGPCLAIPFADALGVPTGYTRLKPDRPRHFRGKPVKYESPKGVPNLAYFPPATRAALRDPAAALVITEGEKKAAKADQEGIPTVGLVGVYGWQKRRPRDQNGCGKGKRDLIDGLLAIPWQSRTVHICYDSDAADKTEVRRAEWHLAECLTRHGATVRIVRLPPGEHDAAGKAAKVGLDDYLVAHGPAAFRELLAAATDPEPSPTGKRRGEARSQAAHLMDLALSRVELFHDGDTPYATLAGTGRTWPLTGRAFAQQLRHWAYQSGGKIPGADAVRGALDTLAGRALFDGPNVPVRVRVAELNGAVYLDLGRDDWAAVRITAAGWELVKNYPVRFRHPRGLRPLPLPEQAGREALETMRQLLNVDSETDWRLLLAWLLAAFRPTGPYPVLLLTGEQGAAKSTTGKLLRRLLDPNKVDLRGEPRDARDVAIAANNSWVYALDNLSYLPVWLSDCLCRLATGEGFGTRELYTDGDEALFNAQRPIIIASIEDVADRGDLLDRALVARLPAIPEEQRRPESVYWAAADASRAAILGALLDVVASGLRALPSVRLARLPRMADFAIWGTACEGGLSWPAGAFLAAHTGSITESNELALDGSPIYAPLRQFAEGRGTWEGTATELLDELAKLAGDKATAAKRWPKKPNALSGQLRRLAPNLRKVGVWVDLDSRGPPPERRRIVRVRLAETPSTPSTPPTTTGNTPSAGTMLDGPARRLDGSGTVLYGPPNHAKAAVVDDVDDVDDVSGDLNSELI